MARVKDVATYGLAFELKEVQGAPRINWL